MIALKQYMLIVHKCIKTVSVSELCHENYTFANIKTKEYPDLTSHVEQGFSCLIPNISKKVNS